MIQLPGKNSNDTTTAIPLNSIKASNHTVIIFKSSIAMIAIGYPAEQPQPIPAEELPAGKIHHNGW
jgi:hypothetical protein